MRLRRRILARLQKPAVVLESHAGHGRVYERAWFKASTGVAIELDAVKAEHLARQRPTWRVYQGDCEKAIAAGLAAETPFDIIDLDPYGEPFTMMDAIAVPGRVFPDVWHLVVNDGTRNHCRRGGAWTMKALATAVRRHGPNLFPIYLQVAKELTQEFAAKIGFTMTGWAGYHTGTGGDMTHYWAVLERRK